VVIFPVTEFCPTSRSLPLPKPPSSTRFITLFLGSQKGEHNLRPRFRPPSPVLPPLRVVVPRSKAGETRVGVVKTTGVGEGLAAGAGVFQDFAEWPLGQALDDGENTTSVPGSLRAVAVGVVGVPGGGAANFGHCVQLPVLRIGVASVEIRARQTRHFPGDATHAIVGWIALSMIVSVADPLRIGATKGGMARVQDCRGGTAMSSTTWAAAFFAQTRSANRASPSRTVSNTSDCGTPS
jgi:hypothetical protein